MLDTPRMRELSVAEQRYQAVMAVIGDGWSVSQVAEKIGTKTTCAERLRARSACYSFEFQCPGRAFHRVGAGLETRASEPSCTDDPMSPRAGRSGTSRLPHPN